MRKIWSSLWLSLCLLVVQQGAVLHELSHFSGSTSSAAEWGKTHGPGTSCDFCLAFDQIAGVAHGTPVVAPLLATADRWGGDAAFDTRASDAPPQGARAPPSFL